MRTVHTDVLVVGAGLFGAVIGKHLEIMWKTEVTWVDAREPTAASQCSACLMRPSWLTDFEKSERMGALGVLDYLFGLERIEFELQPTRAKAIVDWVDPARVLRVKATEDRLFSPWEGGRGWFLDGASGVRYEAQTVIIAAGVWTGGLYPVPGLQGKAGAAFLTPGVEVSPSIRPWAPYKQVVRFNRGDGAWGGDGSSINSSNWSPERTEQCRQRVGLLSPGTKTLFGIRPLVVGAKPCYLKEVEPNLWIATGGAKSGTLGAAWCANKIVDSRG